MKNTFNKLLSNKIIIAFLLFIALQVLFFIVQVLFFKPVSGDKFFAIGFPLTFYYFYTETYFLEGLKTDTNSDFIIIYLIIDVMYSMFITYIFYKLKVKWLKNTTLSLLIVVAILLWILFVSIIGI